MKIKTKLMLALSGATIIPVLIVCIVMSGLSTQQAHTNFESSSQQTLLAIENNFASFVDNIEDSVHYLSNSPVITAPQGQPYSSYQSSQARTPREVAQQKGGHELEVFELLEALGTSHDEFAYVYSADLQGGYVEWPGTGQYSNWDPKTRPWYRLGLANNSQVSVGNAYYYAPDDDVYVSAVTSFSREGQNAGVVVIDFSIKSLMELAKQTVIGQEGRLMVIESSGAILVDGVAPVNNFEAIEDVSGQAYQTLANMEGGVVDVTIGDTDYAANVYTSPSLGWKFVALVPSSEIYASTMSLIQTTAVISLFLLLVFIGLSYILAKRLVTPIEAVSSVSQDLQVIAQGKGDLTIKIDVQSRDETGVLSKWFNHFLESIRVLIDNIKQSAVTISHSAEQTYQQAQQVAQSTTAQQVSIEQIVADGEQMMAASNEAAQNCHESAEFSGQALEATLQGKRLLKESSHSVNVLGQRLNESKSVITELENETADIHQILSTIQEIAEQTNLLALNAAIEAARAGEQGRGFAVVADEVRGLALRTQESTEQIGKILNFLLNRTKLASDTMSDCLIESDKAMQLSDEALNAFRNIENMVTNVRDVTLRTATAAQQQRVVTEDINVNISLISDSAQTLSKISDDVAAFCRDTDQLSKKIHGMVAGFNT
ncbi:methyl-accepting chemotaxis protein [Marinomonas ostreistagni]|uniref:methyl-accepting chemotaxis protein n=1 Tax=Marinomonas ostreistagni TaxID=359209 RepID=UPI00194EECAF|nr:methyl-accepting chemotaxis protein [Marinomonas ostreistagni]MBM6551445.1 methyl-accepting chemotaxis protein [Marinomonas ostreistagni]